MCVKAVLQWRARSMSVFDVLGVPSRRWILESLADGERSVSEIVAALQTRAPISQPAVSQHLKVIHDAGLVTVRAVGTQRRYALNPAGLDEARRWLARLEDPLGSFSQPLDALATEIARGQRDRRQRRPAAQDAASTPDDLRTAAG